MRGALAFIAVVVTAGCTLRLAPLSPQQLAAVNARWPGTEEASLTEGSRLYRVRCSGCHVLYAPTVYSQAEWEKEFPEMADRAKLTDGERPMVFRFLWAASGDGVADTRAASRR